MPSPVSKSQESLPHFAPSSEAPSSTPDDEPESPVNPLAGGIPYSEMKLNTPLFHALQHAGYEFCTPVQSAVIPVAMRGKDVIGQAQTGTGKTCAFLVPFLNRWRPHKMKGPIGLVMLPTRELALQVAREAEKLAPSKHFNTVAAYGGTGMQKQLAGLAKGCDLVVGTPGRIIDHLRRGTLTLENVRYVVLDEADRMLDIGFRPDIEKILRRCPEQRQTLLMSATVPDSIKKLVDRYMSNPIHLNLSPKTLTVDKIRQTYMTVEKDRKFDLLLKVIEREQPRQCIIFVERKRWADNLLKRMKPLVPGTYAIHGDLAQTQREKIMAAFRTGRVKFLIATDVASRGIDVSGISHVINYDMPNDLENYVHRIGRTGRIGKDGVAIAFVQPEESDQLTQIENLINRLIEEDRIEGFEAYTPRRRYDTPKLASTVGEDRPAGEEPVEEPKKAVFGKFKKKYSSRL